MEECEKKSFEEKGALERNIYMCVLSNRHRIHLVKVENKS